MKFTTCMLAMGIALSGSFFSCASGDDEVYLIPKGYSGRVLIFLDRPEGQPVKYVNGKRVYEIASNGVLRTQFGPNPGWTNPSEFFYYDSSGGRTAVPYVDYKDARQDRVQACSFGTGIAGVTENEPYVKFAEFFVGTKADIDAALADGVKNPPGVIFQRDGR